MQETIWSLFPPIIAIALALISKEVYLSLFVGVLSGALFMTGFHPIHALETVLEVMSERVGGNLNIVIFLILLGMIVALVSKSGASSAYGKWASSTIRSKRGALGATAGLGALIFVDDYFNCLTVGTVMRPVTDRFHVSRAKLAYIIDATAAPVCIIAPISSWAAAVGSSLPESSSIDGFSLFLRTIPFNLYAWLTIIMMIFMIWRQFDFGSMCTFEEQTVSYEAETETALEEKKGKVRDLIIPIACLIVLCICAMLYTGGILDGKSIKDAFADCNASLSLVLGSFFAIIIVALMYLPRKIVTFTEFMESLVKGFRAMVPAIMILTFAWTLSGICGEGYLNAGGYVQHMVQELSISLNIFPAVFFLIALGLAFATGTSWGTFGILVPIVATVFKDTESMLLVLTVSSVLAGAVCGDHISPISDTTILASTGAQCNHLDHVSTQIPYAMVPAVCCFLGYIVAGITENGWAALVTGVCLLLVILSVLYARNRKRSAQ